MQGQKRKPSVDHGSSDQRPHPRMPTRYETLRLDAPAQDPTLDPIKDVASFNISSRTYRVRGIPSSLSREETKSLINIALGLGEENKISLESLADDFNGKSKVATIYLKRVPEQLQRDKEEHIFDVSDAFIALGLNVNENRSAPPIVVDRHFIGLTTLSSPSSDNHRVE